jgi:hypothetical protein
LPIAFPPEAGSAIASGRCLSRSAAASNDAGCAILDRRAVRRWTDRSSNRARSVRRGVGYRATLCSRTPCKLKTLGDADPADAEAGCGNGSNFSPPLGIHHDAGPALLRHRHSRTCATDVTHATRCFERGFGLPGPFSAGPDSGSGPDPPRSDRTRRRIIARPCSSVDRNASSNSRSGAEVRGLPTGTGTPLTFESFDNVRAVSRCLTG